MSDLSIYELEDIIWDDFERSGDDIVPHSNIDNANEVKCEDDSCKKPRREVTQTPLENNEGEVYASGSVCKVNDENDPKTLNKEKNTMEKDSWSNTPAGVFAASDDADMANMTSGSELCTDDGMVKDTSVAAESNSFNYPSSHISQSDDLNLFSNDGNGKDSSDLLNYGWPEIGNFEDMDRMLSNCDSSFGLGVTGNDDELVWFTSEDPSGGYDQTLKMDLKFPCSDPSSLTNILQNHELQESDNDISSLMSENKAEFKLNDQKEQSRQQNHEEVKKPYVLKSNELSHSTNNESDKAFTSLDTQQQNKIIEHDYIKSSDYPHLGHTHVPMQPTTSVPMIITGIKSENELCTETKIGSQSNMEKDEKDSSRELGLLDVPEGSSISSELDEISLEATSFRQLQQAMKQLDLRTKLCIRDSLYRLARSAEQRHNSAGINHNNAANCGPLMTEGTNKCTGFMDMETDTNPIDRTIAHLLFHRPSDSSNKPIPAPLKPNTKVIAAEKQSCQEKTLNESNDRFQALEKTNVSLGGHDRF